MGRRARLGVGATGGAADSADSSSASSPCRQRQLGRSWAALTQPPMSSCVDGRTTNMQAASTASACGLACSSRTATEPAARMASSLASHQRPSCHSWTRWPRGAARKSPLWWWPRPRLARVTQRSRRAGLWARRVRAPSRDASAHAPKGRLPRLAACSRWAATLCVGIQGRVIKPSPLAAAAVVGSSIHSSTSPHA